MASSKAGPGSRPWKWEKSNPLKKEPVGKTGPQGLKTSFSSSHMKGNVEMIHFHVKCRAAQGLAFVQKTFEECSTNFYSENREFGIKTEIAKL